MPGIILPLKIFPTHSTSKNKTLCSEEIQDRKFIQQADCFNRMTVKHLEYPSSTEFL